MKKYFFYLLFSLFLIINLSSQSIIADHSIIDDYAIIPDEYLDAVKKMLISIPGESHGRGYMYGLELLEKADPRFSSSIIWKGEPEKSTSGNLRASRTYLNNYNRWSDSGGEEDFWTNTEAVNMMSNYLVTMNKDLKNNVDAFGFGWCWDMTWHNPPNGEADPEFGVRWAGSSVGGIDGDLAWGLDSGDNLLTKNRVDLDDYINAVMEYGRVAPETVAFFTTGPVDGNHGNESGYQRYLKHKKIRDYVKENQLVLFDYADILSWNNGKQYIDTWKFNKFPNGDPDIATGGTGYNDGIHGGCHISKEGCLRLAKALWWMLARVAGWDGSASDEESIVFDPLPGQYVDDFFLELSSSRDDVSIYYTLDGSEPDNRSFLYTKPIGISCNMVVKAVTWSPDNGYGEISESIYSIAAGSVVFSRASGRYSAPFDLQLTSARDDVSIYYSLDESEPDNTSLLYLAPIKITQNTVVKAVSWSPNHANGEVSESRYSITAGNVVFSRASGSYSEAFDLELSSARDDVSIYYTLDGSDPDNTSLFYSAPIKITRNTVVKAVSWSPDYVYGEISESSFFIEIQNDNADMVFLNNPHIKAYWNFEKLENNIYYDQIHANTAYSSNPQIDESGRKGKALRFNGAETLDLGSYFFGIENTNKFTISFWVKSDFDDDFVFMEKGPYVYPLRIFSNGSLLRSCVRISKSKVCYFNSKNMLIPESWNHIVIRYIDGTLGIFMNGRLDSQIELSGTLDIRSDDFILGRNLVGSIDELIICDSALSGSEIENLYKLDYSVSTENVNLTIYPERESFENSTMVSIAVEPHGYDAYYTLDGSDPTVNSILYTQPFEITDSVKVKTRVFSSNGIVMSEIVEKTFVKKYFLEHLQGYWNFDSKEDYLSDELGYNDGNLRDYKGDIGDVGVVGNAISFSGNQILDLGTSSFGIDLTDSFSISFWVKSDSSTFGAFVQKGEYVYPFRLYQAYNGLLRTCVRLSDSGTIYRDSENGLVSGDWNHIVFMYADGIEKLFINGILDLEFKIGKGLDIKEENLMIGNGLSGLLDELMIFNAPLSDEEVLLLYKLDY